MITIVIEFLPSLRQDRYHCAAVTTSGSWLILSEARHDHGNPNELLDIAFPASDIRSITAPPFTLNNLE